MRSKILIAVIVLAAIVGIGIGVGWLAGRGPGGSQSVGTQNSAPDAGTQHSPLAETHTPAPVHTSPAEPEPIVPAEPMVQTSNIAQATTNSTETETNWEDK